MKGTPDAKDIGVPETRGGGPAEAQGQHKSSSDPDNPF